MIESDFFALLNSPGTVGSYGTISADDSPVASIASLCGSRIYPVVLPTNPTLPAISYSFVGGSSMPTLTGTGWQRYRVEVNCWGDTYSDAVSLRAAVITALNGYSPPLSIRTSIQTVQLIQSTDFFDHELLQYRAMVEFYIIATFI